MNGRRFPIEQDLWHETQRLDEHVKRRIHPRPARKEYISPALLLWGIAFIAAGIGLFFGVILF